LNISHERWREVPLPAEPQLILPGFAFANAINSASVRAGTRLAATSTSGKMAAVVTGTRSFSRSYERFL
jgi:hypothetical protein